MHVLFKLQDNTGPAKGKKAIGAAGLDRTGDLVAGLLTCKPHVTADVLVARRAGLVGLRSRVDMPATTKIVNMSTTTAMRIWILHVPAATWLMLAYLVINRGIISQANVQFQQE